MEKRRYEHLIKSFSAGLTDWEGKAKIRPEASFIGPGNAKKEVWLNGRDHLEGLHFNLSWGVHNTLGEWHTGSKPHAHPYPECLFFVGLDTANVNYLGAEIEVCLGDEQESYVFNDPTVVVVPAGVSHGPITTKRLFSPKGFGFFAASLSDAVSITWLDKKSPEANPAQSAGKHARLVKSLKSGLMTERGKLNRSRFTPEQLARREAMEKENGFKTGPGNADHLVWMYGRDLEGMDMNIAWGFCSQPGVWARGINAHFHPADEALIFLGMDPDNVDTLGAEIEIDLGKEHERYVFDKSSCVVCPAGLPHGPVVTRWVDKPFAFLLIGLAGETAMSFE